MDIPIACFLMLVPGMCILQVRLVLFFLRHPQAMHMGRAEGARARRAPRCGATGRHARREWSGSCESAGPEAGSDAITILLTHAEFNAL